MLGHHPRERGLAGTWRSVQNHRVRVSLLDRRAQRRVAPEQVRLADEVSEALWPYARRQGAVVLGRDPCELAAIVCVGLEQRVHHRTQYRAPRTRSRELDGARSTGAWNQKGTSGGRCAAWWRRGGPGLPRHWDGDRGTLPAAAVLAPFSPGQGGARLPGLYRSAGRRGDRGAADRETARPARPLRAELQSDQPVRQSAWSQPGASVRRRSARPGCGLARHLWHTRLV